MDKKYYIFGASGHGKVVLDVLFSKDISVTAVVDDQPKEATLLNIPVLSTEKYMATSNDQFLIAVGNNAIRKKIVAQHSFTYYKAIAASATVSEFAILGEGTVVMPQAVINAATKVGKHCIINSRSVVEHDCVLEDYVHISPNASLAGNVWVGEGTHIGIGASLIQGIKIGKWATIGAGAVVLNDVPDYAVVVGNPGKVIKYNPE